MHGLIKNAHHSLYFREQLIHIEYEVENNEVFQ